MSLPSILPDCLALSATDAPMKLSVLLTLLAATVYLVFAAHGGFGTYQASQSLSTQSGETVTEE